MTENSAMKKAVRARMAQTGEKYTEARRNLLDSPPPARPAPGLPPDLEFAPESFTAVVSGGGMTNIGLVMPTLLALAEEGHPVWVAAHEGESSAWNLASPFDFLVASGAISSEELAARWSANQTDEDRAYLSGLARDLPISFANGRGPTKAWISTLESSPTSGKNAVLYVPDLQVDHPLSDWPSPEVRASLSDFDLMPAQLTGLKSVARESKAAVIGAHCMPAREEGGWRVVEEIVDDLILLSASPSGDADGIHEARIEFHSRWADARPARVERTQVDTRFSNWRLAARTLQEA